MEPLRRVILARGDLSTVAVVGGDAQGWLQGLATNDVASLEVGDGGWGLFLTKPGKVITDALFVRTQQAILVGVPEARRDVLLDHLDSFLVMEDADVELAEGTWITVHGEGAVVAAREEAAALGDVAVGGVRWPDGDGAVVVGSAADVAALASGLGRHGFAGVDGELARRARIEAFLPEYGVDYDDHQNPHEASLERIVVDWDKGCYLGQEAVCMLEMRGKVKRRLVTLTVDGAPPASGCTVAGSDGKAVGRVTSAAPVGDGSVAFARILATAAEPTTTLVVGGAQACVVRSAPGATAGASIA